MHSAGSVPLGWGRSEGNSGICDRLACEVTRAARDCSRLMKELKLLGEVVNNLHAEMHELTTRAACMHSRITRFEEFVRGDFNVDEPAAPVFTGDPADLT